MPQWEAWQEDVFSPRSFDDFFSSILDKTIKDAHYGSTKLHNQTGLSFFFMAR